LEACVGYHSSMVLVKLHFIKTVFWPDSLQPSFFYGLCEKVLDELIFIHWFAVFVFIYVRFNHGTPDIIRSVLDWKDWSILVFDSLLQPHNSIPYVHTGLSMCLYIISLFSKDSLDLRFSSQYIFFIFRSS
jgi:hypothetical protein